MPFILYATESATTGRALGEALGWPASATPPRERVDTLLRYGSMRQVTLRPGQTINNLRSLMRASNKLEALQLLDRSGIRVPTTLLPHEVSRHSPFPLLSRHNHHHGGTDIQLCLQMRDVQTAIEQGAGHFTQYVPKQREYRVHVFNGAPIKTSQKLLVEEVEPARALVGKWIWNHACGYQFRSTQTPLGQRNKQVAVDAVSALGLTFGAVDLIIGDDNAAYVLEVNTAPGLIDSGVSRYVRAIRTFLGLPVEGEALGDEAPDGDEDD